MRRVIGFMVIALSAVVSFASPALAQSRNALVIGNGAYTNAAPLKTPATDAAIVAETLRGAGYDVTELKDVRQADFGQVMRDFLDKVAAGGSDGAAFVYYSGYGAQAEGENYLVPIDAAINADSDVTNEAFRLNDLLDELSKTPLAARVVILDASRDHQFGGRGRNPVPKGLAMGDTINGTLLAFSAAPGALAIDGPGDYSLFTGELVTAMRQPGLDIEQILKGTRIAVNKATAGRQTPWMSSDLNVEVTFFAPTTDAPAPQTLPDGTPVPSKEETAVTTELLGKMTPDQAYAAAVEEDSLEGYQSFVQTYPRSPQAPLAWKSIETRREAVLWRRTLAQNTAAAYWNYLKRYPNGEHVAEARQALADLSEAQTPPADYVVKPVPLPEDYSDEAVDLPEIVPEGVEAPVAAFEDIAPLFVEPPPFDVAPAIIIVTPRIPFVRGIPIRDRFRDRDRRRDRVRDRDRDRDRDRTPDRDRNRDRDRDRDGKVRDGRDRNKSGIKRNPDLSTKTAKTTKTTQKPVIDRVKAKSGVKLPTGKPRDGRTPPTPSTRGTPGTPPRSGVKMPPSGATTTRPVTPGATTRPGLPTRPTTPGITGRPTPAPGAATTRPGLPPVPGTRATAPTVRPTAPVGRPTAPTAKPTAPVSRPTTPTRPTAQPTAPTRPTARPTAPTRPTARPTAPTRSTAKPAAPTRPTARPTAPTRPSVRATPSRPTVRPTRPTVRPTARPAARPAPRLPARPAVRQVAPRPVARPIARPAPARPVARPAAPARQLPTRRR